MTKEPRAPKSPKEIKEFKTRIKGLIKYHVKTLRSVGASLRVHATILDEEDAALREKILGAVSKLRDSSSDLDRLADRLSAELENGENPAPKKSSS